MTWYEVMYLDFTQPDVPSITQAIFTSVVDAARYVESHNNENWLFIRPQTTSRIINAITYTDKESDTVSF